MLTQNPESLRPPPPHQPSEDDNGLNCKETLLDTCFRVIEKNNVCTSNATGGSKFLDFQVTEPDISVLPLGNAPDFQKEIVHIFAIDAKIHKGMANLELRSLNLLEVQRAVYTIDDITPCYSITHQSHSQENKESARGIYQSRKSEFPLFEMSETYLELFSGYARDQHLIFESIEPQKRLQEVENIVNDNDPMNLAQFDLLKNLNDYLELCDIVEVLPLNFFQEMELIGSIKHSNTEDHSQEIAKDGLTTAKRSYTFEELQYLEIGPSYSFKSFSGAVSRSEMETCETMFLEAKNVKIISELVVSNELTLMDDSCEALPVPIILDHEQMEPINSFIEETLKLSEPHHSCMSDGLYLDWHFLIGDHGSSNECPPGLKLLEDISYSCAVYNFDTADMVKLIIDKFIFSDDVTDRPYLNEDKENLDNAWVDIAAECPLAFSSNPSATFLQESSGGRPTEFGDKDKNCSIFPGLPANCVSPTLRKQIGTTEPSLFKNKIIVNTQKIYKDMRISRTSTYEQIHALEKEGYHVIERDLNFPVDFIISAAVCIVWYNYKNLGKKATPDDGISYLPIFVENLAARMLTLLSFSFSGCIMVFEGGSSYISGIVESSDELYSAASSLGIDLQIFYSYSPETTDEIILSCIKMGTKPPRDLEMYDSETLAESFLAAFPSINPLSAHAILSTGGNLVNFVELSPECRIRAVQMFHVPNESISLLSALSRFGEKEICLSRMTEFSSSVSSVTDSENLHYKSNSESRKRKYGHNYQEVDISMRDLVFQGCPERLSNTSPNPRVAFGPLTSDIFHDIDKINLLSKDEMVGHSQQLDSKMTMMKHPRVTEQSDSFMINERSSISLKPEHSRSYGAPDCMSNGSEILDVINAPQIPQSDKCFSPQQISKMLERNNRIDICKERNSGKLQDVNRQVINIDEGDHFRNAPDAHYFVSWSKQDHDMDQDTSPMNFYYHNLSPANAGNHPTFPSAAEIESEGKGWLPEKAYGKRSREESTHQREIVKTQMLGNQKIGFLEECMQQKNDMSFYGSSIPSRRTPLSNAIDSTQLQQGSPWTIEFLNRMREKSKQKRQSNPSAISSIAYGSIWDKPQTTNRKSLSLLKSYKFQAGKTRKDEIESKRQSRVVKPSNCLEAEKRTVAIVPSWTPEDKRARHKLSFSTTGNGGQSKLVWER